MIKTTYSILSGKTVFFALNDDLRLNHIKKLIRYAGAEIAEELDSTVDYVVTDGSSIQQTIGAGPQHGEAKAGEKLQTVQLPDLVQQATPGQEHMIELLQSKPIDKASWNTVIRALVALGTQRLNLRNSDLSRCDFTKVELALIDFSGSSLEGSTFPKQLSDCIFEGASLKNASVSFGTKATNCSFKNANLAGADFSVVGDGCVFDGASFENAKVCIKVAGGVSLQNCNGREANFSNSQLMQSNFDNTDFSSANLSRCVLTGSSFVRSNLSRCDLTFALLQGANLSNADLTGCNLTKTNLTGANLNGADFTAAKLVDTNLGDCDTSNSKGLKVTEPVIGKKMLELDAIATSSTELRVELDLLYNSVPRKLAIFKTSGAKSELRVSFGFIEPRTLEDRASPVIRTSVKDGLARAAIDLQGAVLQFDSLIAKAQGCSLSEQDLRRLAIEAVGEAFGAELPGAEEITRLSNQLGSVKDECILALRSGDIAKWFELNQFTEPIELQKLGAFQCELEPHEFPFCEGFCLEDYGSLDLSSYSKDPDFLNNLISFASATYTGSVYVLWVRDNSRTLSEQPVVLFDSEGAISIISENLKQFLQVLTYDKEAIGAFIRDDDDDYEPSPGKAKYAAWVKRNFDIDATDEVNEIVQSAQEKLTDEFNTWLMQFGIDPD